MCIEILKTIIFLLEEDRLCSSRTIKFPLLWKLHFVISACLAILIRNALCLIINRISIEIFKILKISQRPAIFILWENFFICWLCYIISINFAILRKSKALTSSSMRRSLIWLKLWNKIFRTDQKTLSNSRKPASIITG